MRTATPLSIVLVFLLLLPLKAHAEYTRVELKILGMDCAICAHGVRVAMQKLDGVETVELSLERAQAEVGLKPDNRLSLDQFRQVVKRNGFEPKEAQVTAVGFVSDVGGKLSFEVSGVGAVLIVALDKTAPAVLQTLRSASEAKSSVMLEVVGSVSKRNDGVETIVIASARAR